MFLKRITTGMILTLSSFVHADGIFDGYTLHVPLVDTESQAGDYQQVQLQPIEGDLWRLVGVEETYYVQNIESLQTIMTDTSPVQAFLVVKGTHPSACHQIGNVATRFKDEENTLEVNIYYKPFEDGGCSGVLVPFEYVEQLPVFGVPAGVYNIKVNGEYDSSVQLLEDNVLELN